ncbi:thiamine ABC transporter ATP-binding protein [Phaeobacter gallaeciensis]|uniref:Thiamine ABC transporter ATP-binding protein n=1 Tax=Phaeobacter gallaeciensis TaxID=60890 RepID=A0A366WJS9_9RHOB|nr:ATP-binding cassette domain-containing protein [Phaeobacter gallaeciensis]RBW50358.1 thiamine ABC transporter ATP-binding protein [Phaeobacter gallaeciensis]
MLTLDQITLAQGPFSLVADVSFNDPITALIGPSGAGKSTLLNLIAGFVAPSQGCVLWNGRDISKLPPAQRPVSMLFQDNNLFPHLAVWENLALALTHRRPNAKQSAQMKQALSRVGLVGYETRKPGALSGGQQSRVALARVLLQARPLMLLDEPFAALGPALKQEMLDLVTEISAETGMHVVMVSHDPQDAARIATGTAVVDEGRVSAPMPTRALLENPPAGLKAYLGATQAP